MTYSLAARCPRSGSFGVAITSSSICVASRCAWTEAGAGAVLTQNYTDPRLGPLGLALLRRGYGADAVVAQLRDAGPYGAWRQIAVVDCYGAPAAHSGEGALGRSALAYGTGVVAAGNLLANEGIPQKMVQAFTAAEEEAFPERLMRALEAGLEAGGEEGDEHSAGLQVVEGYNWPIVDLRVDWHVEPIAALRDLWSRYAPQGRDFVARAIDPTVAPSF